MSIGIVAFALGRVVLGIAGSAESVTAIVGEVTDLPEVRTELVDEIANQFASDPMISQYADDETVRLAVETVLSSNEFAAFKDDVSVAAYDVFFEGAESAEVDVNKLASIALDQLAAVTESSELAEIAEEFGIEVDEGLIETATDVVLDAIEDFGTEMSRGHIQYQNHGLYVVVRIQGLSQILHPPKHHVLVHPALSQQVAPQGGMSIVHSGVAPSVPHLLLSGHTWHQGLRKNSLHIRRSRDRAHQGQALFVVIH